MDLEVAKQELALKQDFNIYNIYAFFDEENKGFVTF